MGKKQFLAAVDGVLVAALVAQMFATEPYDFLSRPRRSCRIREMPPVNGMKSKFFISVERCSIFS
jgi:hypothetical protein